MHVKYADVPCPTCGAYPTRPCTTFTGYNYRFKYTHALRERLWWVHHRDTARFN
jgi:hypothetical protein